MNSRFVDRLIAMLQVALLLFAVVCAGRIVVHRGVVVTPVAEASISAADHRVHGGSR